MNFHQMTPLEGLVSLWEMPWNWSPSGGLFWMLLTIGLMFVFGVATQVANHVRSPGSK
jgi:hypothetical protein